MQFAKFKGKGTGELSLLAEMMHNLKPGNIMLADRYYPSFSTIAALQKRGVDLVSISHNRRTVDFTQGEVLGENDHIVEGKRPKAKDCQFVKADPTITKTVRVREFAIEIGDRNGGTRQAIVVTTMTDPTISKKELSDLYWRAGIANWTFEPSSIACTWMCFAANPLAWSVRKSSLTCWPIICSGVRWLKQPSTAKFCRVN